MPYTIVLTPPIDQSMKYVEASQALYSYCQPSYLLSADGVSSPHITVVQFDCASPELASQVWIKMCDKMEEQQFEPFTPSFTGVSFVEGKGPYEDTTWVELSVERGDEYSPIMRIHQAALETLKFFNLMPLNASDNNYRPHLTLARIIMPGQLKSWGKTLLKNPGHFNLEFGLSDEKWQYAHTLAVFPNISIHSSIK